MEKRKIIIITLAAIIIAAIALSCLSHSSNVGIDGNSTITDMANRTIQVPSNIDKVLSTRPSVTQLIYMLAPEKLAGINTDWKESELKYIPDKYKHLPVVGMWNGKTSGSYEEFIKIGPDVVIQDIMGDGSDLDVVEERQNNFGNIPVVATLDSVNITEMSGSITFLGKLLGAEDKASALNAYNEKYLAIVKETSSQIPDSEKKKVYFARDENGLNTAGPESPHAQLISLVGGKNVANSSDSNGKDFSVSIEQVIYWNPDIIITTDNEFYNSVYNNSAWASIKAVKNHQVYLAPDEPANWFDMPPGVNTIVGTPWVAKVIYPDKYADIDLIDSTTSFYKEFYHYDLSDKQAKEILLKSGLNESAISKEN